MMLLTGQVWVSPGQWGNVAFFAFLMACLGGLVVNRAARSDVTYAFIAFYMTLVFGRSIWLGEPWPFRSIGSRTARFLLFTFFMISDPRTTPDSRAGRILFALLVAFGAWYVQFRLFRTNGLLWSLASFSMTVPLIDRLLPGRPLRLGRGPLSRRTSLETLPTKKGGDDMKRLFWYARPRSRGDLRWQARRSSPSAASTSPRRTRSCSTRPRRSCWSRRRPHRAHDGERLQGRSEGVRGRDSGADGPPEGTDPRRRQGALDHLDAYSAPRLVEYFDENPCRHEACTDDADGARSRVRRLRQAAGGMRGREEPRRDHRGAVHGRRVRHPDPVGAAERRPRDLAARERLPDSRRALGSVLEQLHPAEDASSSSPRST